jgi:hypothetical protein
MGGRYAEEHQSIDGNVLSCSQCHLPPATDLPVGHRWHPGSIKSYLAYHMIKSKVPGRRPEVKVYINRSMLNIALKCKTCHHSQEDRRRRAGRPAVVKYPSGCGHTACHATTNQR